MTHRLDAALTALLSPRRRGQTPSCDLKMKARPLNVEERERWDQYFEWLAYKRQCQALNIEILPPKPRRGAKRRVV